MAGYWLTNAVATVTELTMNKNPESDRLQALRSYGLLDTAPEQVFDDLTQLASRLFDVPIALITLVDEDRQWFKSRVGLTATQSSRSLSFCVESIRRPDVMVITDAQSDARFASNPMVVGEPYVRFYAGAPLVTPDGHALGTLCVLGCTPRELSDAQRATLTDLAKLVMRQMALHKKNLTLTDALAQLAAEGERLQRQTEALQASEERLALVLQGANEGWWDWNLVTNQRYYSPRGWLMLGYQPDELPYDDALFVRLSHPQDLADLRVKLSAAIRSTDSHFVAELRLRHREGHFVTVRSNNFILRNSQGWAIRISGTNTDLTDRQNAERAEKARQASQDSYQLLFTNSMDAVLQTRPDGSVMDANPAACAMLGLSHEALCNFQRGDLIDLNDPRLAQLLAERSLHGRAQGELTMVRGNGTRFEAEVSSAVYQDGRGDTLASVVFRDITERQTLAKQLQSSLNLLNNLANRVPGAIYQYRLRPDGSSHFPFISAGVRTIYEVTPEQVSEDADHLFSRGHPDDVEAIAASIAMSAATLQPWHHEYRVMLPEQGVRWRQGNAQPEKQPDGSIVWHGYISDITGRKEAEATTHRLAYFDALTGLPNRRLLTDRMTQALAAMQRAAQVGALMFIDLDNFKQINDAQGHAVGDELLVQVAQRLTHLLRAEDTVARLGGDEFVVVVCDLGSPLDLAARTAMTLADKIREALDQPYIIKGHMYGSSGSMGITLFPKGGENVDDLLREADTAMYRAKESGRNRIAFYEAMMQADVQERQALEQDLKIAVAADQLEVYVQTQVDASGAAVGGELLLRWHHTVRGVVSPACFIPVAEESGLILPLGDCVLWQACVALATLHAAGQPLSLSVNVSPRQFRRDDFVERVQAILDDTGAPASGLILEITEGLLIKNWEVTAARMADLVTIGVRFSIDDFGTGYSSLSYLKKLPLYELKIDKSFVQDTPGDPSDTAIVQSILSVARHLKLRVVAEGVETQAQADFLTASRCECLQGYLFARPVPMAAWLAAQLAAQPRGAPEAVSDWSKMSF